MISDPSPMRAMREAIQPHLPSKAFLKRDRGEGLLVTNAPVFNPGLDAIPGFTLEKQGQLLRILPNEGWIEEMENSVPEPTEHFTRSFLRFKGAKINRDNLLLIVQGLKLLDPGSKPAPAEIAAYDQALRSRCALALRSGASGGGLYAAARILVQINTLYKGE